jgi:hypothetical protein
LQARRAPGFEACSTLKLRKSATEGSWCFFDSVWHYHGPAGKESWCQVAICRRIFGTTVLFEDLPDNPGTIVGHAIEVLATMLWQAELYDLDGAMIRWFELRGHVLSEVRFKLVPDGRGGFFGLPSWETIRVSA